MRASCPSPIWVSEVEIFGLFRLTSLEAFLTAFCPGEVVVPPFSRANLPSSLVAKPSQ